MLSGSLAEAVCGTNKDKTIEMTMAGMIDMDGLFISCDPYKVKEIVLENERYQQVNAQELSFMQLSLLLSNFIGKCKTYTGLF